MNRSEFLKLKPGDPLLYLTVPGQTFTMPVTFAEHYGDRPCERDYCIVIHPGNPAHGYVDTRIKASRERLSAVL